MPELSSVLPFGIGLAVVAVAKWPVIRHRIRQPKQPTTRRVLDRAGSPATPFASLKSP
jgi:hypothetical protein